MTGARVIRLNGCSPAPGSSIYQPQLLEKQLAVLDIPQVEERRTETRGNPTKEIDVTDENTVDGWILCDHWDTGHRRHQPVVRPELNRTVECR